jgi:tetratricopeptide (TPR) repeat protein
MTAQQELKQLLRLAEESADESLVLAANHAGWTMECARGDLAQAEEYIERGLAIYDPKLHGDHSQHYGHDSGICALMNGGMVHWLMGYPDKAPVRGSKAQSLANHLERPLEQTISRWGSAFVAYHRGEYHEAMEHASAMLRLSEELGSEYFVAFCVLLRGAALTGQGQADEGLATTREALGAAISLRAFAWIPMLMAGFLEACLAAGAVDEGLQSIQDELTSNKLTGQRVFESEVRRLHGELLLAKNGDTAEEAEREIQQAIDIARRQSAKSLELRAVMSLARLWQRQGRTEQARTKLAEIYDWFSEGFETADLIAARALLKALA